MEAIVTDWWQGTQARVEVGAPHNALSVLKYQMFPFRRRTLFKRRK